MYKVWKIVLCTQVFVNMSFGVYDSLGAFKRQSLLTTTARTDNILCVLFCFRTCLLRIFWIIIHVLIFFINIQQDCHFFQRIKNKVKICKSAEMCQSNPPKNSKIKCLINELRFLIKFCVK